MKMSIRDAFGRIDEIEKLSSDLAKLGAFLGNPDEKVFGSSMDGLVHTLESQSGMSMAVTDAIGLAVRILQGDAKGLRRKLEGIEIDL